MRPPQGYEIILILLVVILLFGAKRLPDTARGLGRSLRIFKAETKGLREDDAKDTTTTASEAVVVEPRPLESGVTPPVVQPHTVAQPHTGASAVQRDAADR
jgi:sec-independent protein translocase protein TatA